MKDIPRGDFLFITALVIGGVLLAVLIGACGHGPRRCADETMHASRGGGSPGGESPCTERQ